MRAPQFCMRASSVCVCEKWSSILLQNDDSLLFPYLNFWLLFGTSLHLLWFCYLPFLSSFFILSLTTTHSSALSKCLCYHIFLPPSVWKKSFKRKLLFSLHYDLLFLQNPCWAEPSSSPEALVQPHFVLATGGTRGKDIEIQTSCMNYCSVYQSYFRIYIGIYIYIYLGGYIYIYRGINPMSIKCNRLWVSDIIVLDVTP